VRRSRAGRYGPRGPRRTSADGLNAYEASLVEDNGTLVWTMHSTKDRFTDTFNDERNIITGHWDALDEDSTWRPWMDITLTRQVR
jgi:hypothetical protein